MFKDILNVIAKIPNKKKAKLYSITFLSIGILGVIIVNKLSLSVLGNNQKTFYPLLFGIIFFIFFSIILYIFLKNISKIEIEATKKLILLENQEKENLKLINFALDNTADAIYWFDFDGNIIFVNNTLCNMLGYEKEELYSLHISKIDEMFFEVEKTIMTRINTYKYFESELTTKSGKKFPCSIAANYLSANNHEYVCAFVRDISEQKRKEQIIKNSLIEKEILIKEIHHRVKNNLQILSSLLSMQNRRETNDIVHHQLEKTRSRIYAIALVHETIYQGEDLSLINMNEYINKLIDAIREIYNLNEDIMINVNIDNNIFLDINYSVSTGLVIHELLLNSLKHAFKDIEKKGIINVYIKKEENLIFFGVNDNGKGCDIFTLKNNNSLGWQLIESIIEFQLDGDFDLISQNGFSCDVTYEINNNEKNTDEI